MCIRCQVKVIFACSFIVRWFYGKVLFWLILFVFTCGFGHEKTSYIISMLGFFVLLLILNLNERWKNSNEKLVLRKKKSKLFENYRVSTKFCRDKDKVTKLWRNFVKKTKKSQTCGNRKSRSFYYWCFNLPLNRAQIRKMRSRIFETMK